MERKICVCNEKIKLLFSEENDRRFIYDMAVTDPEIYLSMADNGDFFPWEEIRDEDACFFSSIPGRSKYLLIEYDNQIIGTISHAYNKAKVENMEIDIWLRSSEYTGKGLGTASILLLVNYLSQKYAMKTFIIRPWAKNERAIKAYKKCGYLISNDFNAYDYYGDGFQKWGAGDYEEETINMVLKVN